MLEFFLKSHWVQLLFRTLLICPPLYATIYKKNFKIFDKTTKLNMKLQRWSFNVIVGVPTTLLYMSTSIFVLSIAVGTKLFLTTLVFLTPQVLIEIWS
jgi:hypothetical protein